MVEGVSVFGLGKLGLCITACLAAKGFSVVGVDIDPKIVEAVNQGKSLFYEPGLSELLAKVRGSIEATIDYRHAVESTQASFILVPTPSRRDGSFSPAFVRVCVQRIAESLKRRNGFHLVNVLSTLTPGTMRNVIAPTLEKYSGKRCGVDFGLCYNPVLIALGTVLRDFTHPDVVIVGESDARSGQILASIYERLLGGTQSLARTTFENAEMAKIAINDMVTIKISMGNTIAAMCERLPTGDVDVVTRIMGRDSRISPKYLLGGLGYGGPCFPRDNLAFSASARELGTRALLSQAASRMNRFQVDRMVDLIKGALGTLRGREVAILGVTYKPNTPIVEESHALKIAEALRLEGAAISIYDPTGIDGARQHLKEAGVRYAGSVAECLRGTDLCLLAVPWGEFRQLQPEEFTAAMRRPAVLDCWRILDRTKFSAKLKYLAVGLNQHTDHEHGA